MEATGLSKAAAAYRVLCHREVATDEVRKPNQSRASDSSVPGEGTGEPHAGERRYKEVPAGP
jgi:hypothetical protein